MKILRLVVAAALMAVLVASARSGMFDRGAVKQVVPVRADTAPIPQCLPGDPPCSW